MSIKIERNPAPAWFRPLIPLLAIVLTMTITAMLVLLMSGARQFDLGRLDAFSAAR